MSIIAVDIDGVVADLHTEWLARYNKDYKDDLTYNEITKWGIHEFVKKRCGRKIYEYLQDPTIYDNVPPIWGAKDGVEEIRRLGHRVVYVSAGFYPAKIKWLADHGFTVEFPYNDGRWETAADVVLTHSKSLIKADWIVDDRPENLLGFPNKILFDQPWNLEHYFPTIYRAASWVSVVDRIRLAA